MSILRSFTRKSASFGQLAAYISKPQSVMRDAKGMPLYFRHNLMGRTTEEIEKEFLDNERNRAKHRKGEVKLYHDIFSYRSGDTDKLSPEVIAKIVSKYSELRNDKALYFAAAHIDKESHRHIHVMVSGIEAYSGKPISIPIKEFQSIKEEMQRYEKELGLTHSGVQHGKGIKEKSDREYQLELHTGKASRKEEIKEILEKSFDVAMSKEEFYDNVRSNLKLFERGGQISGVDDNRHYRFSTLGFGNDKMQELEERSERLASFADIRGERTYEVEEEIEQENMEEELIKELDKEESPGREV
ncbi:MAG: relaxase/mobilization nuclease domain-containing protein [Bacteroidetes bacterium]|nr:relaxase/mobilization nuclease domain-containing protein [Bacteroidota bacterium]